MLDGKTHRKATAPADFFSAFRGEMDRLLDRWRSTDQELLRVLDDEDSFAPRIEVNESADGLEVRAELPGVTANDLVVELGPKFLALSVQRREHGEIGACGSQARRLDFFFREIVLPWELEIEQDGAEATFGDGLLCITVPKPKQARALSRPVLVQA